MLMRPSIDVLFTAKLAYDCLISAPFNATVALAFLQYYNDTIQFQSTLAYLKNPPASYQQPAIDVQASLNTIQQRVQAGEFQNEYTFEVAVQEVIYATHDDHITLSAGILSAFTFGSPYSIVSASTDGIALPKIYIEGDIIEAIDQNVGWAPSAISKINGNNTIDFLSEFAAINAPGNVEPHGDWNGLMSSGAGDVQGIYSAFEGSTLFYPGENITFTFENGTTLDSTPWLAQFSDLISDDPPILSSGEDLYQYFVLGNDPPSDTAAASSTTLGAAAATSAAAATTDAAAATSSIDSDSSSTDTPEATPSSWDEVPFPTNPVISQPNLGLLNGGVITGYFLNDGVTAVLSIPSFSMTSEAVLSFSTTIGQFLNQSKAAGLTRFIVDVQRNAGGSELLATDAFKQFFPSIDPFGGSRLRAQPLADALGNTFTTYFTTTQDIDPDFYDELAADVWVAPVYLDAATGQNFTDWPEFFGPHEDNGDLFTTIQRNNLSSIIFDENATGDNEDVSNGIVVYGFANRSITSPQPYTAEQIVILTDAYCSSACSIFVELMHHQAGVRTVVAGGRPDLTPMQAVGGSRGAEAYSSVALDADIDVAEFLNTSVADVLPDRDAGNYVNYAGFNLKDQIRQGEDFPLQFAFEPATCRIFYTVHTVYNYLNLWNYVIDAIWRNPSLCISGSANGTSTADPTNTTGPTINEKVITEDENTNLPTLILNGLSSGPQLNSKAKRAAPAPAPSPSLTLEDQLDDGLINVPSCKACDTRNNFVCAAVPSCNALGKIVSTNQCVKGCSKLSQNICGNTQHCKLDSSPPFCFDDRALQALSLCKTPTRNIKAQQT
ncbi:hypothetical protein P7C71_g6129, partial [Lecanoromycetidae sp. Uapishka_2]